MTKFESQMQSLLIATLEENKRLIKELKEQKELNDYSANKIHNIHSKLIQSNRLLKHEQDKKLSSLNVYFKA
jgi:hypothetical protein